ncbi:hypothetical protein ACJRO7_028894 [Eucalyptus globulus]|uniref:Uncharacterized protein n=1 Tax=Eucalyptus globulus TaxID=34317 RepID=A0ABD3JWN1_EUCGL
MGSEERESESCLANEHVLISSGVAEAGSPGTELLFLPSLAIDAIQATFFATHLKIPTLTCPLFGGSLAFEFFSGLFLVKHAPAIFSDPLSVRKRRRKSQEGYQR